VKADEFDLFCLLQVLSRTFPSVRISLELAVKMKWVKWRWYSIYSEKDFLLGPNSRKEFPKDRMPEPGDIPQETIGQFNQPNYEKVYCKTDEDYLYLSMFINWVFTDLDRSFDDTFGDHIVPHTLKHHLYMYSNVGRSVINGDKVTDLLREVPYNWKRSVTDPNTSSIFHYTVKVVDIIEVQVSESDGSLVNFEPGDTVVMLHYKR